MNLGKITNKIAESGTSLQSTALKNSKTLQKEQIKCLQAISLKDAASTEIPRTFEGKSSRFGSLTELNIAMKKAAQTKGPQGFTPKKPDSAGSKFQRFKEDFSTACDELLTDAAVSICNFIDKFKK